jgi:hypothetical protein
MKASRAVALLLEDWAFDYGCPDGLIVTGLEHTVLFLRKWTAVLATRVLSKMDEPPRVERILKERWVFTLK